MHARVWCLTCAHANDMFKVQIERCAREIFVRMPIFILNHARVLNSTVHIQDALQTIKNTS